MKPTSECSGVYRPKPVTRADDLAVMRRIDELHLELPFYGSRRMTFELNKEGRGVNRKRVRRLMRVMGIEALVPRPGTSKAAPGHKIYPYLLRGLKIVERLVEPAQPGRGAGLPIEERRLRCPDRRPALALGPGARARRRPGCGELGRWLADDRRRQCLGADHDRRGARPAVPADH